MNQHQTKVIELVDTIGELVNEPLEEEKEKVHGFATSRSSELDTIMMKD